MRRVTLLSVALCALACGNPFDRGFRVRDPSCEASPHEWNRGDLVYHVLQGPGDGTFDYDPDGTFETRIVGAYDLEASTFAYDVTYDPDAPLTQGRIEGSGTIDESGDADLTYTMSYEDIADEGWSVGVRSERTGCSETLRYDWEGGDYDVYEISYDETGADVVVTFVWADGPGDVEDYDVTKRWSSDGTSVTTARWERADDSIYAYEETENIDGIEIRDFTYDAPGGHREGREVYPFEGGKQAQWTTSFESGGTYEVEYWYDYFGNGEGTKDVTDADGDTYSCALTYEDFDCTQDCEGGVSNGDCKL